MPTPITVPVSAALLLWAHMQQQAQGSPIFRESVADDQSSEIEKHVELRSPKHTAAWCRWHCDAADGVGRSLVVYTLHLPS